VALSYRDGPEPALAQLSTLDGSLAGYSVLAAARADFLRRAGRSRQAAAAFQIAIQQANTEAERRYLQRRRADIGP
jgi:RNA polymerase sigma-70 factor, ECF subfamily